MYGAEKYMQTSDSRLRMGATENWLEYSRDGRVIKGAPKVLMVVVVVVVVVLLLLLLLLHPPPSSSLPHHLQIKFNLIFLFPPIKFNLTSPLSSNLIPQAVVRSKYQEDVMINNHTSVYGSWYDKRTGRWGYQCCHSLEKNAYCLGEEGKTVNESHNSSIGKW